MPELNFDVADAPDGGGDFEPIPAGWYRTIVDESEEKATNDGTGAYLQLSLTVLGPTHENRKLWDRLNLKNKNDKAVTIAKRQFAGLLTACGKERIKNTEELHGIPVMAKVGIQPARGDYEASNSIKGYKPVEGAASKAPTWAAPASMPAGAPWNKK